jgi:lysophospholipase L1-like esterase
MNFLKKIFSPTALTISFLLLIYVFYQSEIFWDGSKKNYYFNYYLISSTLIFLSIITFFINQKLKEYLIILGMSLLVSLYLFEGYLTFIGTGPFIKEKIYENQTGKKWDKRSRYQIYKDLKKINDEVEVTVNPTNYINKNKPIFSLSGISNSQTIHCNENGYYSIYQSDRYGFNNPDEKWDEKEIEYLLVGDSFTHGACVNRPNDIGSVLGSLSNKAVLNLGYDGNGPLIEYATLREYLNPNVKKVIWIYFESNDLGDLEHEKGNVLLMNYLNDLTFTQNLKLKQNEIDDLAIEKIERESFSFIIKKVKNFVTLFNSRTLIYKIPLPEPAPAPATEFRKILELTKVLTVKNNAKLYFVYLPEYSRYKANFDNTNYNLVKGIVNGLNIPFIDIHQEVFEKEENPLKLFPFELSFHFNEVGYKKVSEMIYKFSKD